MELSELAPAPGSRPTSHPAASTSGRAEAELGSERALQGWVAATPTPAGAAAESATPLTSPSVVGKGPPRGSPQPVGLGVEGAGTTLPTAGAGLLKAVALLQTPPPPPNTPATLSLCSTCSALAAGNFLSNRAAFLPKSRALQLAELSRPDVSVQSKSRGWRGWGHPLSHH